MTGVQTCALPISTVAEPVAVQPQVVAESGEAPSAASAPTNSQSVVSASVQPQEVPSAGTLRFEFFKDAWVEVKDQRGQVLMAQINPSGSRATVEGRPPFALVIGNASNVRLNYGDKAVDFSQHVKVDVARFTLD